MAREYLTLGSTPSGEDCAQVGREDYHPLMRRETRAYIAQLRRQFGPEPSGAIISVKGFPHDFGTYHEVCVTFDASNEEAVTYAYRLDNEMPESWDEQARAEMAAPLPVAA